MRRGPERATSPEARRAPSRQGGCGASASHECRRCRVVSPLDQRRGRPKLPVGYLTLRFTADVFPRFSSISYSRCCPSLSVLKSSNNPICHTGPYFARLNRGKSCTLELLAEVPIAASLGGIRPIPAQVDRR